MFRKALISLVATAALVAGNSIGMSSPQPMRSIAITVIIATSRWDFSLCLATPAMVIPHTHDDYYAYEDCGYRRIKIKRWNKSHTHRIIVYKKRWVCY